MRIWPSLLVCLLPMSALADTASDKDFLTNWLESNLSGAGRTITIDGFQGALSSQASLTQMTIADDKGVWLTLKNVTLDWSRSALLTGKIEVNTLSADEIDLERIPSGGDKSVLPSAEAMPLSLPDLPVSINITGINARKIVLGAQVLGQPLEASLTADLSLAGGEGAAHLDLQRLGDGPQGHVKLAASFANSTQVLDLNLDAAEGKGGIAANLLHIPGAPATSLTVVGNGTLSNFAANVNLSTDGKTRLAGQLTQTDDAQGTRSFAADLAGDPTPVFLPEYAAFFGPNVKIQAKGQRAADGALNLTDFTVQAQALNLKGNLALAADGQPQKVNLTGTIGLAQGAVTLPVSSAQPITLDSADVSLAYDKSISDLWHFATTVTQLNSSGFAAGRVQLTADGRLRDMLFDGSARFAIGSLVPSDPGLAAAVGDTITGTTDFSWSSDTSALQVSNLSVTAPGYAITTKGTVGKLAELSGNVTGQYNDLSRLAKLAGRPLSGSVQFDLDGSVSPLSGAFDVTGDLAGTALGVGVAQVDTLLAGDSQLHLSAKRDETGTTLRVLSVQAASLSADISGSIASAGSDLTGDLRFDDLAALGAGYHGSLTAKGSFKGTLTAGLLSAQAHGQDLLSGNRRPMGF